MIKKTKIKNLIADMNQGLIDLAEPGKDMKLKPLRKSVRLRYILFQTPAKRQEKSRTKTPRNPYEDSHQPVRRHQMTRTKIEINPYEDRK